MNFDIKPSDSPDTPRFKDNKANEKANESVLSHSGSNTSSTSDDKTEELQEKVGELSKKMAIEPKTETSANPKITSLPPDDKDIQEAFKKQLEENKPKGSPNKIIEKSEKNLEKEKILGLYEEKGGEMVTKPITKEIDGKEVVIQEGGIRTGLSRETLEKIVDTVSLRKTDSEKLTIDEREVVFERSEEGKLRIALVIKKEELGSGGSGKVYRVFMLSSGKFKAMKTTKTDGEFYAQAAREELMFESKMLRRGHEGISPDLKEWIQKEPSIVINPKTNEEGIMVNRLYKGGDAYVSLEKKDGVLKKLEPEKRKSLELTAFEKHLQVLIHLKTKNIYMNDIRLRNMLVREKEGKLYIALADFGGAIEIEELKKAVKENNTEFNLKGNRFTLPPTIIAKMKKAIKEGNEEEALFYNERLNCFALASAHFGLIMENPPYLNDIYGFPKALHRDFTIDLEDNGYSLSFINLMREMLNMEVDYAKDKDKGFEYFLKRLQKLPKK